MSDENKNEPTPTQAEIDRQREELRRNLNDLEDRVNPAKVFARTKSSVEKSVREEPTPWIAAAAGTVVLIAGAIALAVFGKRR
ncbi:DUF3618 domain-containing protein [Agrococcus casei]|uniref:DUF3618 domain-containing protein n=1 Tax=Agrococcus casei TaxID=343512 RepID=UPI003F8F1140